MATIYLISNLKYKHRTCKHSVPFEISNFVNRLIYSNELILKLCSSLWNFLAVFSNGICLFFSLTPLYRYFSELKQKVMTQK